MIEQQIEQFKSLIPLFTVGCATRDDLDQMTFFFEQKDELDFTVLEDYQNIVCLLSILVEMKQPNPNVKKRLARRLLDEINKEKGIVAPPAKSEVTAEIQPSVSDSNSEIAIADDDFIQEQLRKLNAKPEPAPEPPPIINPEEIVEDKSEFIVEYTEEDGFKKPESYEQPSVAVTPTPIMQQEQIQSTINQGVSYEETNINQGRFDDINRGIVSKSVSRAQGTKYGVLDYVNTAVLFLILLAVGYSLYLLYNFTANGLSNNKNNKVDIAEHQVSPFQKEIEDAKRFIYNHKILEKIVNSPTFSFTKLEGNRRTINGYGRFFFDPVNKMGVLYLSELPRAETGRIYRFWLAVSDKLYPIDLNNRGDGVVYYDLIQLPDIPLIGDITLFITEELLGGEINQISSKVYYTGKLNVQ